MSVVGQKRLHGLRSAGDEDDLRIQVIFREEHQLGKRPQRSLKTRDAAVGHDDVFVGMCCAATQQKKMTAVTVKMRRKNLFHTGTFPLVKIRSVIFTITTDCLDCFCF
jgi:hypothetical protein